MVHCEIELLHEARAALGEPDFSKTVRRALRQAVLQPVPLVSGTPGLPKSDWKKADWTKGVIPASSFKDEPELPTQPASTTFEEKGNTSFPWSDLKQEELRKHNEMMGARIRACRLMAKLTQEQLASMTNIPRTDVVRMEGGFVPITFGKLIAISKALQVPLGQFVDPELAPPDAVEPAELDPYYVADPLERRILTATRALTVREKKIINLVASCMRTTRDQRYDPAARRNRKQGPPTKEQAEEFLQAWEAAADGDIGPALEFMGQVTAPDEEEHPEDEAEAS